MKTKAQKQAILEKLVEQTAKTPSMVFVDISGLVIKDLSTLRANLKKIGAKLQVVKKTLLAKAFEERGLQVDVKGMEGEIAAIFSQDFLGSLKQAYLFTKTNEHLKLRGGYSQGLVESEAAVMQLAQLPGKEELLSQLVRTLAGPLAGFANVLQGNIKGLVYVLAQRAKT